MNKEFTAFFKMIFPITRTKISQKSLENKLRNRRLRSLNFNDLASLKRLGFLGVEL